jgi:hypothetical protein
MVESNWTCTRVVYLKPLAGSGSLSSARLFAECIYRTLGEITLSATISFTERETLDTTSLPSVMVIAIALDKDRHTWEPVKLLVALTLDKGTDKGARWWSLCRELVQPALGILVKSAKEPPKGSGELLCRCRCTVQRAFFAECHTRQRLRRAFSRLCRLL